MAAESLVFPSPALLLWKKAGLQCLFLDEERKKLLRGTSVSYGKQTTQAGQPHNANQPDHRQARQAASYTQPVPKPQSVSPTPASGSAKLAVSAWPKAWQILHERRKWPAKPLVCWTYAGLGDDLVGTPGVDLVDEARKQHIARLIKELNHPGGTHVFWPYALPDSFLAENGGDGALSLFPSGMDTASFFQSVMEIMRPRVVLIFGSEARDALKLPPALIPHTDAMIGGRLHIQMARPESFADAAAFARALAFLRKQLEFCKK